jgi:predicted nucleic acid-binding Zn ribbon protein
MGCEKPVNASVEERICKICGATFIPKVPNQLCCSKECARENTRRLNKEYRKTYRKVQKAEKPKDIPYRERPSVCDRFCDGCVFMAWANGNLRVCEYFFCTGQRRPCPAGTGCTVKQKGKKKTNWRYEADRTWEIKKKREKESVVYHRACPTCGTAFDTTVKNKVYCCKKCKDKAYRDGHIVMKVHHKVCKLCGQAFDTTDPKQVFCGPVCRSRSYNRAYRQRQKEAKLHGKEA